MNDSQLKEMEELALAATPGPWVQWDGNPQVFASTPEIENTPRSLMGVRVKIAECEIDMDYDFMGTEEEENEQGPYDGHDNAAFIAAANPTWVLAAIAEIRRLSAPTIGEVNKSVLYDLRDKVHALSDYSFRHHVGQPVHVLTHSLTVDIPAMADELLKSISAALVAAPSPVIEDKAARYVEVEKWQPKNHEEVTALYQVHKGWGGREVYWDAIGGFWRNASNGDKCNKDLRYILYRPMPELPSAPQDTKKGGSQDV